MSLFAVLNGRDAASTYTIEELEGSYSKNGYTIPRFRLRRKEEKT